MINIKKLTSNVTFKLVSLTLFLILISTLCVGYLGFNATSKALTDVNIARTQISLNENSLNLTSFVDSLFIDLELLSKHDSTQGILRAKANYGYDTERRLTIQAWEERLIKNFSRYQQTKPYYLSLFFVDSDMATLAASKEQLITAENLQIKQMFNDNDEDLRIGNFTLIEKQAQSHIVWPVAVPVLEQEQLVGYIVALIDSTYFFSSLVNLQSEFEKTYVVDSEGKFMVHPETSIAWSHLYGEGKSNLYKLVDEHSSRMLKANFKVINDLKGEYLSGDFFIIPDLKNQLIVSQPIAIGTQKHHVVWHIIKSTNRDYALQDVEEFKMQFYLVSLSVFLFCVVSAIIFSNIFLGSISKLNLIREKMEDIAEGEGDLTQKIELNGNDTVALLAKDFNTFVDKIRLTISDVADSVHLLHQSANNSANAAESTMNNSQQQSNEIDQITVAITQMNQSVEEVANNTLSSVDLSRTSQDLVSTGKVVVEETHKTIMNLSTKVEQSVKALQYLRDKSDKIGSVLDVIKQIAEQTNLLALNAAIEAARAGDSGRGFAVVANEVRELAKRTQQSTHEIHTIITHLRTSVNEVSSIMDEEIKDVMSGMQKTEETKQAFHKIENAVNEIVAVNESIASSTQEQSIVSKDIDNQSKKTQDLTEIVFKDAKNSNQANQNIKHTVLNLDKLVKQFKV